MIRRLCVVPLAAALILAAAAGHAAAVSALSEIGTPLAKLREKYPQDLIISGPAMEKKVALTFDDAPDRRFTAEILEVLRRENVPATFFVVGYRAQEMPELVRRMAADGHAVGNHSYNHPDLRKLDLPAFEDQLMRTQRILRELIGYEPQILRPPYGEINEWQLKWAVDRGFKIINWNVDSLDWKSLDKASVVDNILSQVRPGAIVLQHAGGGEGEDLTGTIDALPIVIRTLKRQGYEFVTVPELLNMPVSRPESAD
jgi:peptidoglycan/xylan/chitin deacetylase (PgdA/CDA1 family)